MAPEVSAFDEAMTPEDLATLIKGLSDEEISQAVSSAGVEVILGRIFATMLSMLRPDQAEGQDGVVPWEGDDGAPPPLYQVQSGAGTCQPSAGTADAPQATLSFPLPNFLR